MILSILTYDGSVLDSYLNYAAFILLLVPVILTLDVFSKNTWRGKYFWIPLTLFLLTFQVCLSFPVNICSYFGVDADCAVSGRRMCRHFRHLVRIHWVSMVHLDLRETKLC
jgi:hypothetical protein